MSANFNCRLSSVAAAALALICGSAIALAEGPPVTVTGGCDESQHNYTWQVSNHASKRIVRIEFPHFGADSFGTPDAWKQGTIEQMNLVNVNSGGAGVCWAEPAGDYPGLAPGATATFSMRIAKGGALQGTGTVRVKFEDGSMAVIPGVVLPVKPERQSPWGTLVATAIIFGAFVLWRESRRRRAAQGQQETVPDND